MLYLSLTGCLALDSPHHLVAYNFSELPDYYHVLFFILSLLGLTFLLGSGYQFALYAYLLSECYNLKDTPLFFNVLLKSNYQMKKLCKHINKYWRPMYQPSYLSGYMSETTRDHSLQSTQWPWVGRNYLIKSVQQLGNCDRINGQ